MLCVIYIGDIAHTDTKPKSLKEVTCNLNTRFSDELNGKAFLNRRLIVRVERVSAVWTRNSGNGSPLRRDLLEWDKMFDATPSNDARFYYLTFIYADHRSEKPL